MKIKFGVSKEPSGEANTPSETAAASEPPGDSQKLKLSFKKDKNKAETPTAALSETPKPKRQYNRKPKQEQVEASPEVAKKTPGRKRKIKAEEDGNEATPPAKKSKPGIKINLTGVKSDDSVPQPRTVALPRIKIPHTISFKKRSSSTPHLRVHARGKPPPRPVGVGYDSEGEDIEVDPAIESQIILTFMVQDVHNDAAYIRQMIDERKVGARANEGGADISLRFFAERENRRAAVNVRGRKYAALLVDLPCVVESMKGWDKRNWWKVADICQKLLVIGLVEKEEEAKTYPIPPEVDSKHWLHPHGLTPPMKWVRKRRFRHNVNFRRIEEVESAVKNLLEKDQQRRDHGWTVKHEWFDPAKALEQQGEEAEADAEYDDEYEMEIDQGEGEEAAEAEDDLTKLMEEGFAQVEVDMEVEASPAAITPNAATTQGFSPEVGLITAITSDSGVTPASQDDTGDEAMESGDEDDGEVDEDDEEEKARQEELAEQREEIEDLRKEIAAFEEQAQKQTNPMFKKRAVDKAKSLKAELELKLAGLGEEDEE